MATFNVVNNNNDGAGSLRQAIISANGLSGADVIEFAPALNGQSIILTTGELSIEDSLTINGLGADNLTINGNKNSRVFNIDDEDPNNYLDVTLSDLTVTGGHAFAGAGIFNQENLTIANSTISGNTGTSGGGIDNYDAILTINDSTITDNKASSGGGIDNYGNAILTVNNSTITNNEAIAGGGIENYSYAMAFINNSTISGNTATYGGGIYDADNTTLDINSSTINDNTATYGGGVYHGNQAIANITNSTISGNVATDGGGVYIESTAQTDIKNSTISNNSADRGAGIYNRNITNLASTIVANNLSDLDIAGDSQFTSNGNNLIGSNANSPGGLSDGINADIVGTANNPIDPLLGTLQDNGGATQTQALLNGSPAINAGNNLTGLLTDQRGESRVFGAAIDIGAYERNSTNPNVPTPGNDNLTGTPGDDFINGLAGNDLIAGNSGMDTLLGNSGMDTLLGNDGDDLLNGGPGSDTIDGNNDNDTLLGNGGSDSLNGGSGNDSLNGSSGSDTLLGDSGNDSLIGGGARDTLDGGSGNDSLNGAAGNDRLDGNGGRDTLFGGGGRDILNGGAGDDSLVGSSGNDILNGGAGNDIFAIEINNGSDRINDFVDNSDLLSLPNGLTFADLTINPQGTSTEILDSNGNLLTTLKDIDAALIDSNDFISSSANTNAFQPININFGAATLDSSLGFVQDIGEAYDEDKGYGWVTEDSAGSDNPEPIDLVANGRDRTQNNFNGLSRTVESNDTEETLSSDPILNSLIHMQYPEGLGNSYISETSYGAWEYDIADGEYQVEVSVGDPIFLDSSHVINIEGESVITEFVPIEGASFAMGTAALEVNDGRLTIDAIGGENTKINYVNIIPIDSELNFEV